MTGGASQVDHPALAKTFHLLFLPLISLRAEEDLVRQADPRGNRNAGGDDALRQARSLADTGAVPHERRAQRASFAYGDLPAYDHAPEEGALRSYACASTDQDGGLDA